MNGKQLALKAKNDFKIPANFVFALKNNDIGYTITGRHPIRKYKIYQGGYTKIGYMDDN